MSTSSTVLNRPFSPRQILAIEISTRTMSVLSLLGSCFIITTFLSFPFFRKPINRLVFYATLGNILANVATLISTSGIPSRAGTLSALCEFQGVLIQWFMMADSLWVFCMATNVFLVFWHGYDAQQLRYLEKWYLLFAYGLTAVPPLIYVIMDHHSSRRIIGPATLWCWVAKDVDWMRIAFFYAPVWVVVTATLTIYVMTGIKIYRKRAHLRYFERKNKEGKPGMDTDGSSNPFAAGNILVTTQIKHDIHQHENSQACSSPASDRSSITSFSSTRNLSSHRPTERNPPTSIPTRAPQIATHNSSEGRDAPPEQDRSGYRATAFASSLPHHPIAPITPAKPVHTTHATPHHAPGAPRHRTAATESNDAAWTYLKVAFLMFVALFVVWIPSSSNRLYQFIRKDQPSYALNIISAIVLPLQGAWNATIYIYTTKSECKRAWGLLMSRLTGKPARWQPAAGFDDEMGVRGKSGVGAAAARKKVDGEGEGTGDAEWRLEDVLREGPEGVRGEKGHGIGIAR